MTEEKNKVEMSTQRYLYSPNRNRSSIFGMHEETPLENDSSISKLCHHQKNKSIWNACVVMKFL